MGKSMDKGNTGNTNKPKLSTKEKQQKKKLKQTSKSVSA